MLGGKPTLLRLHERAGFDGLVEWQAKRGNRKHRVSDFDLISDQSRRVVLSYRGQGLNVLCLREDTPSWLCRNMLQIN